MRRRDFLLKGAAGAGALTALGASAGSAADVAGLPDEALPPSIARLRPVDAPPPISEAERAERRRAAQRLMADLRMAALFVEPGANLTYFGDIPWGRSERVFGLLIPARGEAVVISPAFEAERARLGVKDRFEIRAWQEDESPYALIVDTVRAAGVASGAIAVDPSARVFVHHGLEGAAGSAYTVVSGAPVVEGTRGVKTPHEVDIMRFANRITLDAYHAAFETLRPGMTQQDLARNVSAAMTKLGYEGYALVLFGQSAAYPHGAPNPAPLAEGDVVLVDGGLVVHGYESDDTRTVTLGRPSDEARAVFDVVHEAQAAALAQARPGVPAGSVDEAARKVITAAGYGPGYRLFTHRLGHGIGLEGHEWPYLVKDSTVELRPGMTFSDEPGIYQYGKFGLRLEDIMVIADAGAELLTEPATTLRFDPA